MDRRARGRLRKFKPHGQSALPPTPLFASDAPIRVTIKGPMSSLASNRAEVPRPATMTVDGVAYPSR